MLQVAANDFNSIAPIRPEAPPKRIATDAALCMPHAQLTELSVDVNNRTAA